MIPVQGPKLVWKLYSRQTYHFAQQHLTTSPHERRTTRVLEPQEIRRELGERGYLGPMAEAP